MKKARLPCESKRAIPATRRRMEENAAGNPHCRDTACCSRFPPALLRFKHWFERAALTIISPQMQIRFRIAGRLKAQSVRTGRRLPARPRCGIDAALRQRGLVAHAAVGRADNTSALGAASEWTFGRSGMKSGEYRGQSATASQRPRIITREMGEPGRQMSAGLRRLDPRGSVSDTLPQGGPGPPTPALVRETTQVNSCRISC